MRTLSAQLVNKVMHKTNTHIEVLPPSVYALRGIIFYTVAKINQNLADCFLLIRSSPFYNFISKPYQKQVNYKETNYIADFQKTKVRSNAFLVAFSDM